MRSIHRGLTLIELLVVIVILLVLTSVTIPLAMMNNDGRKVREAARLVSGFISGAKNRAIETGRPVGVQFGRLSSNPNSSMLLSYVEVPPLYAGETVGSVFTRLEYTGFTTPQMTLTAQIPAAYFNNKLVRVGDYLKFNYQGRTFRISGPDSNSDGIIDDPASPAPVALSLEINLLAGESPSSVFPWAVTAGSFTAIPMAFQIARQPARASGAPLQLPEGSVVDLNWSGLGSAGVITPSTNPLVVLISPGGSVTTTYGFDGTTTAQAVSSPLHFLIGSSVKAIAGGETSDKDNVFYNYQDARNFWVSVGHQTGLVSTTEVTAWRDVDADGVRDSGETVLPGLSSAWAVDGSNSRGIAQTFQSAGGR